MHDALSLQLAPQGPHGKAHIELSAHRNAVRGEAVVKVLAAQVRVARRRLNKQQPDYDYVHRYGGAHQELDMTYWITSQTQHRCTSSNLQDCAVMEIFRETSVDQHSNNHFHHLHCWCSNS